MIREHRWNLLPPPDAALVATLAREINVSDTIAQILIRRGIDNYDKAKEFFRPTMGLLHDPFLMDGMEEAVARVERAISTGETVLIYGDYDVDGTNGAAMLYMFLLQMGMSPDRTFYHIPDRIKEGYGISPAGIRRAQEHGATLLLSVDCGITAVEQVEYARAQGIDVVICDHHEPGEQLPLAYAVLDPLKPGDRYPFKTLCGTGVAFKLIQAIAIRRNVEESIHHFIDFVTLATTADIVPLVGENRILVRSGLARINSDPRPGLRALIEGAGLTLGKLTAGQIVFVIAPRNNAVGRLGDAMRAVHLLTCTDPIIARELASVLEAENLNRRKIDEETFLQAQELVENFLDVETEAAIVLHQDKWHPGVIGIVASRLVEKYYRPTVMMTTVNGVARGSARSVAGFDIYQALKRVEDKMVQFGGHKYAAGLAVELDRIDEFRDAFSASVRELMSEARFVREINIDAEIDLKELTPRFRRVLNEFAPFGPQNQRPIFLARDVEVFGLPRIVGRNHLRFKVRKNGQVYDTIGFGLGDLKDRLKTHVDLVFSVDETDFGGASGDGPTFPQLKLKDLRESNSNNVITKC